MKQKNLAFCLGAVMLIFSQASFAQKNILVGIDGGISMQDLNGGSGGTFSSGWSSRIGPDFGIMATLKVKNNFSVQVELNYATQGGKKNGEQPVPANATYLSITPPDGTPSILYANLNNQTKIGYAQLPILAKLSWTLHKGMDFYVNGGPFVGLMVAAKTVANGYTEFYTDKAEQTPLPITNGQVYNIDINEDIRSEIRHFNVGIQGGVGLQQKLYLGYLTLTVGGTYGFIPIYRDGSSGQNNTSALTLKVGYLFKI